MKDFFKKIYVKIGQFNMTVLEFLEGIKIEGYLYLFLSALLSQSLMIVCPAFMAAIFPICLIGLVEGVLRNLFRLHAGFKKRFDVVVFGCSVVGTIIGILLGYAWITFGPLTFVWF